MTPWWLSFNFWLIKFQFHRVNHWNTPTAIMRGVDFTVCVAYLFLFCLFFFFARPSNFLRQLKLGLYLSGSFHPAHCSGWGAHFAGLSANCLCQAAFAHSTASLSFLSMGIAQLDWGLFWTSQMCAWCCFFCGWVPSPSPLIFLAPFCLVKGLFPSFRSDAPLRNI